MKNYKINKPVVINLKNTFGKETKIIIENDYKDL